MTAHHSLSPYVGQSIDVDDRGPALDRVLYAAFNQEYLTGARPHVASSIVFTRSEVDIDSLVPADMAITRSCQRDRFRMLLAGSDTTSLLIEAQLGSAVQICASGQNLEAAKAVVDSIGSQIPVRKGSRGRIPVAVWHMGGRGPNSVIKRIQALSLIHI